MSTEYEISSGNVFKDLNIEQPVEAQAKAELAYRISSIIKHRHLKQKDSADLLGIDQPKISKLMRGQLNDFSIERLMNFMMKLDRDIEIVIKKRPKNRESSKIAVSVA